jgi:ArsR family transcriptional regulator
MDPVVFYKNLAEETRLKILLLTRIEEELCVCEYVEALGLSQPKVSRHLAQLRKFGLLSDRREGKWVFYSLSKKLQIWEQETLKTCFDENFQYIHTERTRLNAFGERPKRQQACCS